MAELLPAKPYPAWNRYVVMPVCKTLCRVLFWLLGPIKSIGAYRVPKTGPVLILSNHLADVDPIVVQVACHRAVHFMAKSELFEMRLIGRMIRWFQAFPVKRGEPDRAAMRHAIDLLKMGEAVCVFPEGQLSEDGELQELKAGVALIVRQAASDGPEPPSPFPLPPQTSGNSLRVEDPHPRSQAHGPSPSGAQSSPQVEGTIHPARVRGLAVICCGIRNSNKVMPYGRYIPRFSWSRVYVAWGEVKEFSRTSKSEEIVEWATGQLRELTTAE